MKEEIKKIYAVVENLDDGCFHHKSYLAYFKDLNKAIEYISINFDQSIRDIEIKELQLED